MQTLKSPLVKGTIVLELGESINVGDEVFRDTLGTWRPTAGRDTAGKEVRTVVKGNTAKCFLAEVE